MYDRLDHIQNFSSIHTVAYSCISDLILVQILFSNHFLSFFRISVCDFTYGYRSRHSRQIQLVNPILFVIQLQCDLTFNIAIPHMTIEVDIHDRFSW